jgi:hypothetical protein
MTTKNYSILLLKEIIISNVGQIKKSKRFFTKKINKFYRLTGSI